MQQEIERNVAGQRGQRIVRWEQTRAQLMASVASVGQAGPDPITTAIEAARSSYLAQRFTAMQAVLTDLEQRHLPRLVEAPAQAAAVNLLLGVALAVPGRARQARQRFRLALQLAADSDLDPALYPPTVIALFRQARDEARSAPAHRIALAVTPAARIAVNGRPRGLSTAGIQLAEGLHYVVLSRTGYRSEVRAIHARPGLRLRVVLERLTRDGLREQLGQLLLHGRLPVDDDEALGAIGELVGASQIVGWELAAERLRAVLLQVSSGRRVIRVRAVALDPALASSVWQQLNRPAAAEPSPRRQDRPLWGRWWVWTIAAAAVGGAIGTATAVITRDTDVLVRVR